MAKVELFLGQLKELSRGTARERAESLLREVQLWDERDRKIETLSRGMNQKVQFVAATMHQPDLIIIDEPFSGLDPVNTRTIKSLLYRMQERGAAIIMSTHQMHQVEEMCERILLINRGQQVLYGRLQEIRQQFAGNAVEVDLRGELGPVDGVARVIRQNGSHRLLLDDGVPPETILKRLVAQETVTVERFERVEVSLDEIFVQMVGQPVEGSEAEAAEMEAGR